MLMTCVITCTQFKCDYMDAIDMWDAARRVEWVRWVEVWVKKFGGGWNLRANLYCETMTKSISPLLVHHPGSEKWGLCEEGSEPNLGEN
jgi:hypothetical protein